MRKTITIGDLGTIITGKTPPTTNKNYYGDYAVFIKPTDISEQSKYTYETEEMYSKLAAEKYESSLIPKGAICVPCIGTIGTKMTMAPCDCYTNQSINSIVCNENYDNEYVYYLIKNFLPGLKAYNLGTASGREYVSKSNFEKIELVAEQNKTIQKRIGVILSRYDSLIENYQKQIKLLEEAAQRLYKEWFVDLHFPGHENTKIVDGVPEGWEKKTLDEYCSVFTGKKNANAAVPLGKYKFFTCGETPLQIDSFIYDGPAIIISGNGSYTGRTTFYEGKFDLYQRTYACTINNNDNKNMIYGLFEIVKCELTAQISGGTHGAAIPYIVMGDVTKFTFTSNDIVLRKFSKIIKSFLDRTICISSQIRLLTEARDRLLPKLMSGDIKIESLK